MFKQTFVRPFSIQFAALAVFFEFTRPNMNTQKVKTFLIAWLHQRSMIGVWVRPYKTHKKFGSYVPTIGNVVLTHGCGASSIRFLFGSTM